MVMVIFRHTFKDYNTFCSRAMDWVVKRETPSEKRETPYERPRRYKYISTYSAWPVKNEAWCIWDIANPIAIADFEKEFNEALGDAGTAEASWVTEFTPETFPPFQYIPK